MSAWRHARAIVLLPGAVAVLVPAAIVASTGAEPWTAPAVAGGVLLGAAGFALWLWTVLLFARIGKGTLAPWDPTRHLVAEGPYRHVRNPMITGVAALLAGEALVFGSTGILVELAIFIAVNHAFFLLHEEPALERRFGEDYRRYRERVPRWLPAIGRRAS
jgi:protein-S-isoprenylcysteine O-methyltransferase Ste14